MKFTALFVTLCAFAPIANAAETPLSCSGATPPCPPLKKIFGACGSYLPPELTCKTESKNLISPAHSSKTYFAYYSAPAGYAFEPDTARGVISDGRGTHGVDGSITSDQKLYCLWGTAGTGSYASGYCEVRARQIAPQR
ncbi:MAG TPA: hypothetical protein VKS78_19215 [Roseiarcus sp.]|nr:hypothetical protein [Roseiarcus sp.]